MENQTPTSVNAKPVKAFFVSMLTRDITLEDAILDLIDNCVDGALRIINPQNISAKNYSNYRVNITFSEDSFKIEDNCGGIEKKVLTSYAFRMGRPSDSPQDKNMPTVGVYGIGMKRAIFKMGKSCRVRTQHAGQACELSIDNKWLLDENKWEIPLSEEEPSDINGTTIEISDLFPGIKDSFSKANTIFLDDLTKKIATTYALILDNGFEIIINGTKVSSRGVKFAIDCVTPKKEKILPYIFKGTIGKVKVFLVVGLTKPLSTPDDENGPYSKEDAGWTIICNDRVIVYCDKTELTGWGERPIPKYHSQFRAISGIVEFYSEDAKALPTTTTKRGIEAGTPLFSQIRVKMREGLKYFIDYTNSWKGKESESRNQVVTTPKISLMELKNTEASSFTYTKCDSGEVFKPNLPKPEKEDSGIRTVSFQTNKDNLRLVAEYLDIQWEDRKSVCSEIGETCFKNILRKAEK